MKLGELLKKYRQDHNLSLRAFAELSGVSNSYLSMLELGRQPSSGNPIVPSLTKLNQIADAMGLDINDLLSSVDDMPVSFREDPGEEPVCFKLSELEKKIIVRFRSLSSVEKDMVLRSLGIAEEKGDLLSSDQAAG